MDLIADDKAKQFIAQMHSLREQALRADPALQISEIQVHQQPAPKPEV